MLHVLCRIGRDDYAIAAESIERVLPYAALKAVPGAPAGIAGLLNYHGLAVPVVDLSAALIGTPAALVLTTRILLCPLEESASGRIGLIAENVSRTEQLATSLPAGVTGAACLNEICLADGSLVQKLAVPAILPEGLLASLNLSPRFAE
jgi:chemotaxis-related protein WspB